MENHTSQAVDTSALQRAHRIAAAADFNASVVFNSLFTMFGYRQRVAYEILQAKEPANSPKMVELSRLFDECENSISQLIGFSPISLPGQSGYAPGYLEQSIMLQQFAEACAEFIEKHPDEPHLTHPFIGLLATWKNISILSV